MPTFKNIKYVLPSDTVDNTKMNKLRAAVLGANDGLVSISSVVMGVAGAGTSNTGIAIAGLAALIAGALSMAVGEYVSVSSQADAEKAYLTAEREKLKNNPDFELDELAHEYMKHGVSAKTANMVASELTKKNALKAHLRMHFNLDPDDINNPWHAAVASLMAFATGGLVPYLTIVFTPVSWRVPATVGSVVIALITVGYLSARAGDASYWRAILRVVCGGLAAMGTTYLVGFIFGTQIG